MALPTVITAAGVQPTSPTVLRAELVALVTASNPGFTADLPGSLVEDITSTDVGALVICDSAKVDLTNSLTPYGANEQLLIQLGNIYGPTINAATNTSVYCVFSGPVGFLIAKGFTVSDGTYQYVIQDGGIVGSGGETLPLFAVATLAGTWPVLVNTVTQLVTSIPLPFSNEVTVTNPLAGLPGAAAELYESYRARVLRAGLAASMGMARYLKTLLMEVPGVQSNLVSVQQQVGGGWKVICGGGDPYQVAYAIFMALFDISTLVGSTNPARNITVSINDFPDTYSVIFVNPPQEVVTMVISWRSTSPNYVDPATVAALVQPSEVAYVNALSVGQPMNLLQLKDAFLDVLPSSIPRESISILDFAIYIDGVLTPPDTGTGIITGDPESYFFAVSAGITVNQI